MQTRGRKQTMFVRRIVCSWRTRLDGLLPWRDESGYTSRCHSKHLTSCQAASWSLVNSFTTRTPGLHHYDTNPSFINPPQSQNSSALSISRADNVFSFPLSFPLPSSHLPSSFSSSTSSSFSTTTPSSSFSSSPLLPLPHPSDWCGSRWPSQRW